MRETHAYCAKCQEESAITPDRKCLWCSHPVDHKIRGRKNKVSAQQLEVIYRLCTERNVSLTEISKKSYRELGYANWQSCNSALSTSFKKAGFPCLWEARKHNKQDKELIHS